MDNKLKINNWLHTIEKIAATIQPVLIVIPQANSFSNGILIAIFSLKYLNDIFI